MNVSVVIPAYNEANVLPQALERLDVFLERSGANERQILVVDDGSTDGTARAVEALGLAGVEVLRHSCNRGKGAAVRTGVLETDGDVVIVTDADGNYLHDNAAPFLEALRSGADIVLASRAHAASRWRVAPGALRYICRRRVMGRLFNSLVRAFTGLGLADTQTGLKFLRGHVARELFRDLVIEGFAYDVELLYRAAARGFRTVELPLAYCCPTADSSVTFWDPARMALDLLCIRWLCRRETRGDKDGRGVQDRNG